MVLTEAEMRDRLVGPGVPVTVVPVFSYHGIATLRSQLQPENDGELRKTRYLRADLTMSPVKPLSCSPSSMDIRTPSVCFSPRHLAQFCSPWRVCLSFDRSFRSFIRITRSTLYINTITTLQPPTVLRNDARGGSLLPSFSGYCLPQW